MDEGYLVYGNRLYNYCGCDSSGYKFNDLIEDFISCSIAEDSRESYMTKEDALDCFRYCKENGVSAKVLYILSFLKQNELKNCQLWMICIILALTLLGRTTTIIHQYYMILLVRMECCRKIERN